MLYALVAGDCAFAVDVFTTRESAKRALAEALVDEPQWSALLSVIALERGGDEQARCS